MRLRRSLFLDKVNIPILHSQEILRRCSTTYLQAVIMGPSLKPGKNLSIAGSAGHVYGRKPGFW